MVLNYVFHPIIYVGFGLDILYDIYCLTKLTNRQFLHRKDIIIIIIIIIMHVYVAPEPGNPVQHYYPPLRPVSTQHTSQLPREHTMRATIIGTKRYSNT